MSNFNIRCLRCGCPYQIEMPPEAVQNFNQALIENPSAPTPYIMLTCPECHAPSLEAVKQVFESPVSS